MNVKSRVALFWILPIVIGLVVVSLFMTIPKHSQAVASCPRTGKTHEVILANHHASPEGTYAQLCDKITFINGDSAAREIGFGPHEHHLPYAGIYEATLNKGQRFTITLSQAGLYHFHDHFDDEAAGYFSVSH